MGIPDHLTCLLRNLYADQEATVRIRHGTGSKLGKEYFKTVSCHPAYLNYMQNASCKMPGAGIKIYRRNINKLRYADDTTLMVKSKEPLDAGEKGDKKAGFQKTKIMASGPITS